MKRIALKTSPLPVLIACLLTIGIFVFDLYAPVGMAVGMLYVAPVALIAMWSPPTHYSLVVLCAIVCTSLLVVGLLYFSPDSTVEMTIGNHALALSAIWMTVFLSLLRKRMEQKTRWIDVFPRL
ncbi:MAG: hypothetical protein ICV76_02740 [Nitrospiraceae bacterium]|jgi:hypothetical protein|nr:hypothetical protein [Nitrospiraceae bacterium]